VIFQYKARARSQEAGDKIWSVDGRREPQWEADACDKDMRQDGIAAERARREGWTQGAGEQGLAAEDRE
jgi:hypothetical protein